MEQGEAGAGGTGDRAERLAADARASAEALLDWLGPRLDDAGHDRAPFGSSGAGRRGTSASDRPRQSAGPCSWCPVCALVAALRGEQPELTARLAEQAAGLVVLVRLLLEGHGTHHQHATSAPGAPGAPEPPRHRAPGGAPPEAGGDGGMQDGGTRDDGSTGPAEPPRPGDRPTGRRSPRPSPRLRSVPHVDEGPPAPPAPTPPPPAPGADRPVPRRLPDVQRIPVRRVPSDPC